MKSDNINFTICLECHGNGRKRYKLGNKKRIQYQIECEEFEKNNREGVPPVRPKGNHYLCPDCNGTGLIKSSNFPMPDATKYPSVAIIGGGIGGVALAVACLHRGIPFTIYERDNSFDARAQGYGLTLQQASKAIQGLGITNLNEKIISTRHVVHLTNGKIIGEWGMRKWMHTDSIPFTKRSNMHIARQHLRSALVEQLGENETIQWGHQLVDLKNLNGELVELKFEVNGKIKSAEANLVVGADGIRSTVRNLILNNNLTPLRYLNCIVILGICKLSSLKNINTDLLDSATVFQTANGNERIYMMPYSSDSVMWQLSFPMTEVEAKTLSGKGVKALKEEAIERTKWHSPIPEIVSSTDENLITGYPVYDRDILNADSFSTCGNATLLGDAAHPMSPFKGQGANQALLDALSLARTIHKKCNQTLNWREIGIRSSILNVFETEMLERSASKVKDSAEAAKFLHSEIVLGEGNFPRGHFAKKENNKN